MARANFLTANCENAAKFNSRTALAVCSSNECACLHSAAHLSPRAQIKSRVFKARTTRRKSSERVRECENDKFHQASLQRRGRRSRGRLVRGRRQKSAWRPASSAAQVPGQLLLHLARRRLGSAAGASGRRVVRCCSAHWWQCGQHSAAGFADLLCFACLRWTQHAAASCLVA